MNLSLSLSGAICFALSSSLSASPSAQQPQLLLDVNQTPPGSPFDSEPRVLGEWGGEAYLTATTPNEGFALWAMDVGTHQLRLVAGINQGPGVHFAGPLVVFQNRVWFAADDGSGHRLWCSDGTTAGTGVAALGLLATSPRDLTVHNGLLLFSALIAGSGRELVVTDGTAAGVVDLYPGSVGSEPSELFVHGSHVYFAASAPGAGRSLWRTDGTLPGTAMIADPAPASTTVGPYSFSSLAGDLLFVTGEGLWRTDGTTVGTVEIESLPSRSVTTIGGTAYFTAGSSVYSTDGTVGGAQLVTDFPGALLLGSLRPFGSHFMVDGTFFIGVQNSYVSDGTAAGTFSLPVHAHEVAFRGGEAIFVADSSGNGDSRFWRTDGTAVGTSQFFDLNTVGSGLPEALATIPSTGEVLFSAFDFTVGRELWVTDGTAGGTGLVANIAEEAPFSEGSDPHRFVDAAGSTYFAASDGTQYRLWRTDGTAANTVAVADTIGSTFASPPVATGADLYFVGYDVQTGAELWTTDGTPAGTRLVRDIHPGANSSTPTRLTAADDYVYFLANAPNIGRALWRSDGTAAGTVAISTQFGWGTIDWLQPLGRGCVFSFTGLGLGIEPYFTDGTVAGTVQLADLNPGAGPGSSIEYMQRVGDRVFFTAFFNDALVVTDGTPAGTVDLTAGMADPPTTLRNLTPFGDRLLFTAYRASDGIRFWVSDGTVAGTHTWHPSTIGASLGSTTNLVTMGDLVLYNVSQSLWRSDGTAAGTFQLHGSRAHYLAAVGDRHAFFGSEGPGGFELWRTDGTAAGTIEVADIWPGSESSVPQWMTLSDGKLFFAATDAMLGEEPFVLDVGTHHQSVGFGCSASGGVGPEMRGQDPVLGTTLQLEVVGGPDPGLSVSLLSSYTTGSSQLGIGYCRRFVEPFSFGWSVEVFQNGRLSHPLPLPNDPSLVGLQARVQALVLGAGGIPAAELTNGVTLELGY